MKNKLTLMATLKVTIKNDPEISFKESQGHFIFSFKLSPQPSKAPSR